MRATTAAFGPALTVSNHRCLCGRPLDEDGNCYACDPCLCGEEGTDRETGYVDTCSLHPATVPVPDAMARLKSLLCVCTSDEFARPACAVHGR